MNVRQIVPIVLILAIASLLFTISPVSACDPEKGDYTDCPATPSVTSTITPTFTVTSTVTLTLTITSTVIPTSTLTPTATPTSTSTPVVTQTATLTPTQVIPTATPITPTPTLTPTRSIVSLDERLQLECLLPDANFLSNALGVVSTCKSMPVLVRAVKAAPTPLPVRASVPTATPVPPKGDAPQSARAISKDWETIDPKGMVWYRIDNGNNYFLEFWLDANGTRNIAFSIFSPDQANDLSAGTKPKGAGSYDKFAGHDLFWKGYRAIGSWYALVRNYNDFPVQYKVGVREATTERNCVGYWEWLPTGEYVYWIDCGLYSGR